MANFGQNLLLGYVFFGVVVGVWAGYASYQVGLEDGESFGDNLLYALMTGIFAGLLWFLVLFLIAVLIVAAIIHTYLPNFPGFGWVKNLDRPED